MPLYAWEAKSRSGEVKKGETEAANSDIVTQRLRSQNLQVVKVRRKPKNIVIRMPGSTGISAQDLVIFTRQFATMIDAGLPLVQCLEILSSQMDNPEFKKVLLEVKMGVESGTTLADSLKKHPKVFGKLFVNLVAAGEAGGILDTILLRLANYIEKNMKLVKQVKGAMVYPVITMGIAFVVTIVLLVWVIPVFQKMFTDFGSALPAPTQFVVDLSEFTRSNIVYIILTVIGIVVGFRAFLKSPRGAELFDRAILKVPIVGPLVQRVAVAKFTRTLGTMLSSGVPILDALEIVASASGNIVVEKGLRVVRAKISEGRTMAQPLAEIPVFPPMVVQMIAVGESTGAMDTMLNKIADFYEDEVDGAVRTLMSAIEPIMMVTLAVILGGLVISMYLPVFTMAGAVGH